MAESHYRANLIGNWLPLPKRSLETFLDGEQYCVLREVEDDGFNYVEACAFPKTDYEPPADLVGKQLGPSYIREIEDGFVQLPDELYERVRDGVITSKEYAACAYVRNYAIIANYQSFMQNREKNIRDEEELTNAAYECGLKRI